MSLVDVETALAAALTAKGSGALSFDQMMDLIEIGRSRGLSVSTIDATCDNGWKPRPDMGFHVHTDDLNLMADNIENRANATAEWAREAYKSATVEDGVEFEVWFWND